MRYPEELRGGYSDRSAMYGFEINGISKLCMFWRQGSPSEIGQWLCDFVRGRSKEELLEIAEKIQVFHPYKKLDRKMVNKLTRHGFQFSYWHAETETTWDEALSDNGWLLGTIELGFPFTCDCTPYMMASDWTYIVKIDTENHSQDDDAPPNKDTIHVRFVVYQMLACPDESSIEKCKSMGGKDPFVNGMVAFEDIAVNALPPVYVPPYAESKRYPNHVMRVSYDYGALPENFCKDQLRQVSIQQRCIAMSAK